jgi:hypothetical protein
LNDFVDVRMIISNIFMMNQTTPHLGARSGLMNNESSNQRKQPGMDIALAFE